MKSGRRVVAFGATALIAASVVGAVTLIARDDGPGGPPTSAIPRAADATTQPPEPSVSPVSADVAPNESTSTTVVLLELPRIDFETACRDSHGDQASFVDSDSPFALRCSDADGALLGLDVWQACKNSYGQSSRGVVIDGERGAAAWRCTTDRAVELGGPDWNGECVASNGSSSVAFLVADDSRGWRCASIVRGLYVESDVPIDAACQFEHGPEVFGEITGDAPDDQMCYGVTS